jgi:diguanylate cyclase (GGDEF)-like protein/PAS domain S-box-containing protein
MAGTRMPALFATVAALVWLGIWYVWVLAPVELAERSRARNVDVVELLRGVSGGAQRTDTSAARALAVRLRQALPRVALYEAGAADRLTRAAQRMEDALRLGTYQPQHLIDVRAEIGSIQRVVAQEALHRRAADARLKTWSVASVMLVLLFALATLLSSRWRQSRPAPISILGRERLGHLLFSVSPEAVCIADADERIVAVNPAFCRVTGYEEAEAVGQPLHFNRSGEQDDSFFAAVTEDLGRHGSWTGEIWQRRKTGEAYAEKVTRVRVDDGAGRPAGFLTVSMDLTANKDAERLITWQAQHDALTKLPNRTLLTERLGRTLVRNRRGQLLGAVLTLDLDRFKLVNESVGPVMGDRLLIEAAMRVAMVANESDTVARLGGDEFALLVPEVANYRAADRCARDILHRMREPFVLEGREVFVTASVGVALFPQDADDPATIIQMSSTAMARAKDMGGNVTVFYQAEMNAKAGRRVELESELRRALRADQLQLHFQPIVDLSAGRVVGGEALMRWHHPEWGMVSPAEFIPVAEDSGLIVDMGRWLIAEVAGQLDLLAAAGLDDIRLSLNLSGRQLKREEDMSAVLELVGAARADRIAIEITESVLMEDAARIQGFMNSVRELGARVALDDFGTGYSSLSYLRQFRFDVLKVDRSFVRNVERDNTDLSLVAAIVSMGRILGADVVIEGVETDGQLRCLQGVGCNLIQGFLYSKPLSAAEFLRFVSDFEGTAVSS